MDKIIKFYFRQRIDQIGKSQSVLTGETTLSAESIDISQEVREVLNISLELQTQCATAFLEKKDLIDTTESKIEMLFQNIITSEAKEKDAKFDDIVALAITYYNMGKIHLDANLPELLVISESYFTKCMTLLKGKELERKTIVTIIRLLHALHTISHIREPESYSFLNTAMELYSKYTKEEIAYSNPINFTAILGLSDDENANCKIILENLHLTTLLRMSNLYKENYRDKHEFVIYVHNILDQLIARISYISSTYYVHWAITSSDLFQYFVHNYRITEARNHLIAAEYMMNMFFEKEINTLLEEDDEKLYKHLFEYNKAGYSSVIKFWGLYGVELLVISTNELLQRKDDNKSCETDDSNSKSVMESKEDLPKLLIFTDKEKNFENLVGPFADKCVNLNDAKAIFVNVLKCFNAIKEYFTIEKYPIDFVDIKIATSKVYKCLATFEQDEYKQINLHKLRIKIMEKVFNLCESEKVDCTVLLYYKIMMKISSELLISCISILDVTTNYLQLNVEYLNKNFKQTEKIEITLKKPILNIIKVIEGNIIMFNMLEEKL